MRWSAYGSDDRLGPASRAERTESGSGARSATDFVDRRRRDGDDKGRRDVISIPRLSIPSTSPRWEPRLMANVKDFGATGDGEPRGACQPGDQAGRGDRRREPRYRFAHLIRPDGSSCPSGSAGLPKERMHCGGRRRAGIFPESSQSGVPRIPSPPRRGHFYTYSFGQYCTEQTDMIFP